jgi:RNA polymerase sporulation-specific sigma factor
MGLPVLVSGIADQGHDSGHLEQMVVAAQAGDRSCLTAVLAACEPIVQRVSRPFFLQGADTEDLLQEARVGLLKAVRDYRSGDAPAGFPAFAALCTKRQVLTAVKAASRHKHVPLNSSHSLSEPQFRESGVTLEDRLVVDHAKDFCERITCAETASAIRKAIREVLSPLERQVIGLHIVGCTREEIAGSLSRDCRSVENALYRAMMKVRAFSQGRLEAGDSELLDGQAYVGNTRSMMFHALSCRFGPVPHYTVELPSYAAALSKGFFPCTLCVRPQRPSGSSARPASHGQ